MEKSFDIQLNFGIDDRFGHETFEGFLNGAYVKGYFLNSESQDFGLFIHLDESVNLSSNDYLFLRDAISYELTW